MTDGLTKAILKGVKRKEIEAKRKELDEAARRLLRAKEKKESREKQKRAINRDQLEMNFLRWRNFQLEQALGIPHLGEPIS